MTPQITNVRAPCPVTDPFSEPVGDCLVCMCLFFGSHAVCRCVVPSPGLPRPWKIKKKELPEDDESAAKKPKMMTLEAHLDGVRRHLSMPRTTLSPCERPAQGDLKNTKKKKEEGGGGRGGGQAEDVSRR